MASKVKPHHVTGKFVIPIIKVQPDGELEMDTTPVPASPSPSKPSSSNGQRKGPAPRPYLALKPAMQRRNAAFIAKRHDPDALYHAALSTTSTDTKYVMRRMKEDPQLATKIKEWHRKYKKGKGIDWVHIS